MVEDSFCGEDAACFCGDLLLLLQDLSRCLEPCESLSQNPWCSLEGGNACCGVRTSCLESLWLSLVRRPEGTSLWIWKVLHSCWLGWASPLSTGRLRLLLLVFNGRCFFHLVCGDLEPQSAKFGKVVTVVQKAVPWHPG